MPGAKLRPLPVGCDGSGNAVALPWASRFASHCSLQLLIPCAAGHSHVSHGPASASSWSASVQGE
eukprot:914587-Pyramimonas_sp.AAC.1